MRALCHIPTCLCLVLALLLVGCGTAGKVAKVVTNPGVEVGEPKDQPSIMELTAYAELDANTNEFGERAPINIWVFQLSDDSAFLQSDYFELTENPRKALRTGLEDFERIQIEPGESKVLKEIKLERKAVYLGIVAGYIDIERKNWRTTAEIKPRGETYSTLVAARKDSIFLDIHR